MAKSKKPAAVEIPVDDGEVGQLYTLKRQIETIALEQINAATDEGRIVGPYSG